MTAAEFKQARQTLGYNPAEMAAALGLGKHGARTIYRIEAGANVSGPMRLAVARLLDTRE